MVLWDLPKFWGLKPRRSTATLYGRIDESHKSIIPKFFRVRPYANGIEKRRTLKARWWAEEIGWRQPEGDKIASETNEVAEPEKLNLFKQRQLRTYRGAHDNARHEYPSTPLEMLPSGVN